MSIRDYAVRFAVLLGIVFPYWMARGDASLGEHFLVVLGAVVASHGAVWLLRRLTGTTAAAAQDSGPRSPLIRIGLTALVAIGSLGFLVYSGRASSSGYRMVDKLMTEPARWVGKDMKVHGHVETGSIQVTVENQETRRTFALLGETGKRILVHHTGPVPDTFKDASEVIAKGVLTRLADGSYMFEATELMAKCPSKYEAEASAKKSGELPTFK